MQIHKLRNFFFNKLQGSDVWITNPGEETMQESLNPWSPQYVKMQLGQLQYEIEEEGEKKLINTDSQNI